MTGRGRKHKRRGSRIRRKSKRPKRTISRVRKRTISHVRKQRKPKSKNVLF